MAPSPDDAVARAARERVTIVDMDNRVIGEAPRARMRAECLVHRATYVFVLDGAGQVLVQRRTATKDIWPAFHDLAAGGVVAAGESYDEGAAREAAEELGLEGVPLEPRFEFYYEDPMNRCFGRVYTCVHTGPFRLQPEEVEWVRFEPIDAVLDGRITPVTPDSLMALRRLVAEGLVCTSPS